MNKFTVRWLPVDKVSIPDKEGDQYLLCISDLGDSKPYHLLHVRNDGELSVLRDDGEYPMSYFSSDYVWDPLFRSPYDFERTKHWWSPIPLDMYGHTFPKLPVGGFGYMIDEVNRPTGDED